MGVFLLLFLVILFLPEKGIPMGDITLEFPSAKEFLAIKMPSDTLSEDEIEIKKIIDSVVITTKLDSAAIKKKLDSIKHKQDSIRRASKHIMGNDKAMKLLAEFFTKLDHSSSKKVRIMHYGDSQIESDRITSYIRNDLQRKFGGNGVGLFPVIQVSPKWTLNNSHSENWKRYVGFGKKNPAVEHMKYGALMSFCKFTPIPAENSEQKIYEGWIKLRKAKISYRKVQKYSQLNIYLRNMNFDTDYEISADGKILKSGTLASNTPYKRIQVNFTPTPNEIKITFKGKESPDIFGLSLEGNNGVIMDNIPLRGSSGTLFTRQDPELLGKMYNNLSPDLIMLEFGGNTIPYIKTNKQISDYARWLKQQIAYLKRLNPGIPILLIGPGDMSIKDKTDYVTYPKLPAVRDALKEAVLSSDCLFWDMYEGMGGKNSMPKWVNAEPALGASDYIHFTPKGAVKISKIFLGELYRLYDSYKTLKKPVKETANDTTH
jgi:lysophospholipase L1-like esterase